MPKLELFVILNADKYDKEKILIQKRMPKKKNKKSFKNVLLINRKDK